MEIVKNLIVNSSKENDIVIDPFLGSGTTAVACINTGRHYIGFELDQRYYDIACKRLQANRSDNRKDKNKGGIYEEYWKVQRWIIRTRKCL